MQHRLNMGKLRQHEEAFFEPENMLSSPTLFAHDRAACMIDPRHREFMPRP